MLRLAASFVPSRAVAEEVVQDTWLAALRGLETFEGRASLKTWLFRILVNRARSTGSKEQRSVPVADPEPAVDPTRFGGDGGWADPPEHWIEAAESRMEAGKLADRIRRPTMLSVAQRADWARSDTGHARHHPERRCRRTAITR